MSEKIYCGKGKQGQYGLRVNLCLSDIPAEHTNAFNNKTYVNLDISQLRQPDQRGNTHTVTVNTWKPQGQQQAPSAPQPQHTEDLPWY